MAADWLIAAIIVAVFFLWLFRRSSARAVVTQGSISGPGKFRIEVVGEAHYQAALEKICGGRTEEGAEECVTATLVLDDSNPYDDLEAKPTEATLESGLIYNRVSALTTRSTGPAGTGLLLGERRWRRAG